jgi:kinesin family protein 5
MTTTIIADVLKGYNGTIFAYGQTSSGKTFTMEGPDIYGPDRGVIPRIVENIFNFIMIAPETLEFTVRISFVEIYLERIRDLLTDGGNNLQIHENNQRGVYIRNCTELYMQSPEEVLAIIATGNQRRRVASTGMNDQSSRSHAVVLIELHQKDVEKGGAKTGKLYMVDLAGSEKVSKTGADGETLEEAKNINKSLSALGLVIMNLTESTRGAHIPYRDSKLTRILQESLGGNSRTTIVICCSPSSYNSGESLSSLQFGKRAKKVKNKARVNVEFSAAELAKQLEQAKAEIRRLTKRVADYEAELNVWRSGGTVAEEDRAKLSGSSGTNAFLADMDAFTDGKLLPGQTASGSGAAGGGGAGGGGISEVERDEFLLRERELLDLLDEKDEEIRQLERENDALAQEKVTITKLAAESFHYQQQVKVLEGQINDLQEDCETFELTIESLIGTNVEHQDENERLKRENAATGTGISEQSETFKAQVGKIEEMVASLRNTKPGRKQLPMTPGAESGTAVDLEIAKTRAHINMIHTELSTIKIEQEAATEVRQQLAAELEEAKRACGAAILTVAQTDEKLDLIKEEKDRLADKLAKLTAENESLEGKYVKAIETMIEAEMVASERSESQLGQQSHAMNILEGTHQEQRALQLKEVADLKDQITKLTESKAAVTETKNKLELKIQATESERDSQMAKVKELEAKLSSVTESAAATVAKSASASTLRDITNSQLEKLAEKQRSFKSSMEKRIAALKAASGDSAGSSPGKLKPIERMVQEMTKSADLARHHHDEVQILKRQVMAKDERINSLQTLYRASEDKLLSKQKDFKEMMARLSDRDTTRKIERRGSIERKGIRGGKAAKAGRPTGIRGGAVQRSLKGGGNGVESPTKSGADDLETEVFV